MANTAPVLEFKNINKSFSGVSVLKDVSFQVRRGEIHALIGENGAGKSTLMKILSGAHTKDSGDVFIDDERVEIQNPSHARELGVSIIYQELSLIPQLNAEENVFLGSLPTRNGFVDWKTVEKEAKRVFALVNLNINTKVPVRELSAAKRQLIEVARSLLHNAKIIIMDEPTSSLTNNEVGALFASIRHMKEQGITVLYISHKLEELFTICDTITVLKDGVITGQRSVKDVTKQDLIRMMVGRDLQNYYLSRQPKIGDVALECKHLNNGRQVRDVSFSVRKGEIVGFAGLVGAGRTETMRSIFYADKLESGEIWVDGKQVHIDAPLSAIKHGIAFATEDRKTQGLVLCLPIAHNTTLASLWTIAGKHGLLDSKKETALTKDYIEKLTLRTTGPDQKVMYLSGGNQQKVVIAKWLNSGAKIYIFDEPTRGIDVGAKADIYQLMSKLADDGAAIIMISSELPEVLGVSDRIIVMHEGRIMGEVTKEEATEELVMTYAFGGS
ncbi:ribose import ATP-binding protein RbsA [Synergistales bacterium]|nr:ribose import ATP-binding protein RbsA [Synergistales bacterium]